MKKRKSKAFFYFEKRINMFIFVIINVGQTNYYGNKFNHLPNFKR